MKLNRKDAYRVNIGAVSDVNKFGTLTKYEKIDTFYCVPVRNSRGLIITLNEVLTNTPLVKRVYDKNNFYEDEYDEVYYDYAYDKTRDMPQIGDIEVIVDQDYETDELREYVAQNPADVKKSLDTLELRAIENTSDGYCEDKKMDYYNQKLYICPLDDDFIIVSARTTPLLGNINGFRELITKRMVIKRTSDECYDFDHLVNLNPTLESVDIKNINLSILATREIPVDVMESYMELTPEEVEAKISIYLAKKSRERIDEKKLTK